MNKLEFGGIIQMINANANDSHVDLHLNTESLYVLDLKQYLFLPNVSAGRIFADVPMFQSEPALYLGGSTTGPWFSGRSPVLSL